MHRPLVLLSLSAVFLGAALSPAAADPPQARPTDSSCPSGAVPGDDFLDVPVSDPHEASIDCMTHWGVATGRTAALYNPAGAVSRDQMAAFVARAVTRSGGTLPSPTRDHFRDDDRSTHQDSINRLAEAQIVTGTGPESFSPSQSVTRAQMAAFLVRAYDFRARQVSRPALVSDADYFADDAGQPLEPQINAAARAGFTGGYADGTYRPGLAVPRNQMASFLARMLDAYVDDLGSTAPPAPTTPPLTAQTPITQRGAGPAKPGMTLRQVEAATGRSWIVEEFETFDRYCFYASPSGLEDTFYAIIQTPDGAPMSDPRNGVLVRMTTSSYMAAGGRAHYGLGVRDSWQRVQQIVGGAAHVERHLYDETGLYVDLDSPDAPGLRLRLEIQGDIVTDIHGGTGDAASYPEGCA